MRQFDLTQSIEDLFDPIHCLTHPNMDEWNFGGGWVGESKQCDPRLILMHSLMETDVLTVAMIKKAVKQLKGEISDV